VTRSTPVNELSMSNSTLAANALAINDRCPWSGDPVAADSLTVYRGHSVGFCNPGCRDKFEKASTHFDSAIEKTLTLPRARTPAAERGPINVRAFQSADMPQLLKLMRALAEFEGYLDQFKVTETDLRTRGLSEQPDFYAWVATAAGSDRLLGMAVTYCIPWTFDLRPTLVLKELYVDANTRSGGVGKALMNAVIAQARDLGAGQIKWTVLPQNHAAQAFYQSLGAQADRAWENWQLAL